MTTAFAPKDKLLYQLDRLAEFNEGNDIASPSLIEVSPTNSCNAKCPWCFYVSSDYKQKHSREELNPYQLHGLLDDLERMRIPAVTWTGGGDPSMFTMIDYAIDEVHRKGIKQGLFTNGYKPISKPEKLAWIRITVTERFTLTRHVAAYAAATKVGVNFNLTPDNEHHLHRMAEAARDLGCRYFQVRPALADRWDLQTAVEVPLWLRKLETDTFKIVLTPYKFEDHARPHGYPKCYGHQFVPFVWHNGDVSTCAYHFGKPEYTFGNLSHNSFRQIWLSKQRLEMVSRGIDVIPECQHCCKNHEINKVLASMRGEYERPDDVEFL